MDTVTELKNITEGALVDSYEVEPALDDYGGITVAVLIPNQMHMQ